MLVVSKMRGDMSESGWWGGVKGKMNDKRELIESLKQVLQPSLFMPTNMPHLTLSIFCIWPMYHSTFGIHVAVKIYFKYCY